MTDGAFWTLLFGVTIVTSIISGVLGMAGGLVLLAALLVRLDPVVAIPVHGIVQLASNGSRAASNSNFGGGSSVISATSSQSGWNRRRVWNSTRARFRYENVKLE